jgi:flagellar basal body-associated protein FliL
MITNNPNQRKVFLIALIILLAVNIVLLTFLLVNKEGSRKGHNRPDRKAMISNFLKTDIGFDQQQLLQYDTASNLYRSKTKHLFENFRANKNEQLKQLVAGNFSDSVIQLLGEQSAANHKTMEVNMLYHIKNIRQLCKPSQLPAFDSLFNKVFGRRDEGGKK